MRISKTEYYLNIARAVSKRSTCLRRQYGCVIVKNDEIIATGYNGSPRGTDNCCDIGWCYRELIIFLMAKNTKNVLLFMRNRMQLFQQLVQI